jgi:hypothetical protein
MLPLVPKNKKLGFKIKQINLRWGLTCETLDSLFEAHRVDSAATDQQERWP